MTPTVTTSASNGILDFWGPLLVTVVEKQKQNAGPIGTWNEVGGSEIQSHPELYRMTMFQKIGSA